MSLLETWAMWFATFAHWSTAKSRYRKYTNEPYINHPAEVVRILRYTGGIKDRHVLAAAWLHDTVEDVFWVKHWMIRLLFGAFVSMLVRELTDVTKLSDGKRSVRKEIERNRMAKTCYSTQTIKYADLISNTQSITQYDPGFAKVYMSEKRDLLMVMTKGNAVLRSWANNIVSQYYSDKERKHVS